MAQNAATSRETTLPTSQALRIMGVWVRRADALLADTAVTNAASAVDADRSRQAQDETELLDLDLRPAPASVAG
jgi:hypothetical protein